VFRAANVLSRGFSPRATAIGKLLAEIAATFPAPPATPAAAPGDAPLPDRAAPEPTPAGAAPAAAAPASGSPER